MGNQEFHAYALLTGYLEKNGFKISHQVAGLETCFIAEYGNSSSGRRVGLCCEYDALPG
jgi:metal-dependent amidase/aminoacylase/carboxypeptidase family protein